MMRRTISFKGEVLYTEERKSSEENYGLNDSDNSDNGWRKVDTHTNELKRKQWINPDNINGLKP